MQFLVLLVLAIEIRFVPAKLLGRRDLGVFAVTMREGKRENGQLVVSSERERVVIRMV